MEHIEIEMRERDMADLQRVLNADFSEDYDQPTPDPVEMVDHPPHYTQAGIECIDVLEQLAGDGHDFRILNAIKYLWRYRHKGGQESLAKAVWYIERVLEFPNDE